jgi:hypothetical protein
MYANHHNQSQANQEKPIAELFDKLGLERGDRVRKKPLKVTAGMLRGWFGDGDRPRVTNALYRRIAKLCDVHGVRASKLVYSTMKRSQQKENPLRWFSVVINEEFEANEIS